MAAHRSRKAATPKRVPVVALEDSAEEGRLHHPCSRQQDKHGNTTRIAPVSQLRCPQVTQKFKASPAAESAWLSTSIQLRARKRTGYTITASAYPVFVWQAERSVNSWEIRVAPVDYRQRKQKNAKVGEFLGNSGGSSGLPAKKTEECQACVLFIL
ncbi:hypothetical protein NDU88_002959 [Pleurodeles waltl]|uniref:Uncharacterized protein n=1 Tax=Pleurodeles waltl TaxID=8319 RepID=A0AAV7Q8F4_PLEWA|nr:hypothetical protein NDU88_002959 [Pleurodeles waltl]